jgi:hypothetical protein
MPAGGFSALLPLRAETFFFPAGNNYYNINFFKLKKRAGGNKFSAPYEGTLQIFPARLDNYNKK